MEELTERLKFQAHELVVDLRAWPHWRHLVNDDLVRKACALNAEVTQLRLELIEVPASNELSIKFNSSGSTTADKIKFPPGDQLGPNSTLLTSCTPAFAQ